MSPPQSRRKFIYAIGASVAGYISGCVSNSESSPKTSNFTSTTVDHTPISTEVDEPNSPSTNKYAVYDLYLHNGGAETKRVEFTVTAGQRQIYSDGITLTQDNDKTYGDIYPNGQSISFDFTIGDEKYTHESSPEQQDNRGVNVLIYDDRVEIYDIVH